MTNPYVILTGDSRGIGLSVCRKLLQMQFGVIGISRTKTSQELEQLSNDHSLFLHVPLDLGDKAVNIRKLVQDAIESKWSVSLDELNLTGIVHNAGKLDPIGKVAQLDLHEWHDIFQVNLFSGIKMYQSFVSELRRTKGAFVIVSSGAATSAYPAWAPYCTSKAAVNMLVSCIAAEDPEITAIALRPGVVDTEMQAVIRNKGRDSMNQDQYKRFVELYEKEQLLPPELPAEAIVKILQAAASLHNSQSSVGNSTFTGLSGAFMSWNDDRIKNLPVSED